MLSRASKMSLVFDALQASSQGLNFLNNKRVVPKGSGRVIDNVSPRTGQVLCPIAVSGQADVDAAVDAARAAQPQWRATAALERGRILRRAADILRENREQVAKLDVVDNGKPIWEADEDINTVVDSLDYYAGFAPAYVGEHVPLGGPGGSFCLVQREPYGVVGGVGAWNYSMQCCAWKAAPALASGNAFVYKPSPLAPLPPVVLAEALREAGLPPGLFNIVQGDEETGRALVEHPDLDKISFTGSVPTGEKIMHAAAKGVRNVTLELGGKSPLIIFEDADIDNAVRGALMANFPTQGEVCSNAARVFVHADIYDKFLSEFVSQTKKMVIGDPLDKSTTVGATISAEHAAKVLGFIERAKAEGAVVECGGERVILQGELANGHYLSPCVLTNCRDDMEVIREEVFGSVACILKFENEEEVLKRANNTQFGLGGGLFTRDLARAHRVASSIEAGVVWVNTYNLTPCEVPFGGFKGSGLGREGGRATLDFYTQTKSVYIEMGDVDCGPLYTPKK